MTGGKVLKYFKYVGLIVESASVLLTGYGLFLTIKFGFFQKEIKDAEELLSAFESLFGGLLWLFGGLFLLTIFFAFTNGKLVAERFKFVNLESELKERIKTQKQIASMNHNIGHATRDINCYMTNMELGLKDEDSGSEIVLENLNKHFNNYTSTLTSNIKDIFDQLTDDVTAVSIKMFLPPTDGEDGHYFEDIEVETIERDNVSKRKRQGTDKSLPTYPAYGNSAFIELFDDHGNFYFACDNLKSKEKYVNLNENWKDFYNACLVTALVVSKEYMDEDSTLVGAITVDNFSGGLDNKVAIETLSGISDLFALTFLRYNNLQKTIRKHPKRTT